MVFRALSSLDHTCLELALMNMMAIYILPIRFVIVFFARFSIYSVYLDVVVCRK
jgi:hypothetical protein